jgi:hypothetical protein
MIGDEMSATVVTSASYFLVAHNPKNSLPILSFHLNWPARTVQVRSEKTEQDDTAFCQALAQDYPDREDSPHAQQLQHAPRWLLLPTGSLRAGRLLRVLLDAAVARWLNMIEVEFSALSRECLERLIAVVEQKEKELLTLVRERVKKIKIQ